jgi:hypothetical protein
MKAGYAPSGKKRQGNRTTGDTLGTKMGMPRHLLDW